MHPALLENAGSFGAVAVLVILATTSIMVGIYIQRHSQTDIPILVPITMCLMINAAILLYRLASDRTIVDDELVWHRQAIAVSEMLQGRTDAVEGLTSGKEGYAWLVGALYALAGPTPLLPISLNIMLLALIVPLVGALTSCAARALGFSDATLRRSATAAVYLVGTSPVIAFWAPRLLREIVCMFLISVAVLCFAKAVERLTPSTFLGTILATGSLIAIRGQVGIGLAAGLLLSGIIVWSRRFSSLASRIIMIAPLAATLFAVTWVYVDASADLSAEHTAYLNRALADADSAFAGGEDVYAASDYSSILAVNLPRVLFGPFPTELSGSGVMILAALSNLVWLPLLLAAIALPSRMRRQRLAAGRSTDHWPAATLIIATVFLTFVGILSINAGNYGLVTRMRLMPLTLLIPLASVSLVVGIRGERGTGPQASAAAGGPRIADEAMGNREVGIK